MASLRMKAVILMHSGATLVCCATWRLSLPGGGGGTGFGVQGLGRIQDKLPTHSGGLVNIVKPRTAQPEKLPKARLGVGKASLDPVMPHGGLVPGQSPFRLAVLAKLGLQKTGAASRNLRPVGRWQGIPGICDVQERLAPDVFPHLLEHIGQPYSWGPQPSTHRRVHTGVACAVVWRQM